MRHSPKEALIRLLFAARAPQDYINAAENFRCQGCDNTKQKPQTHEVSPPRLRVFNHEVGIDVFEGLDATGKQISILNAVCMGTTHDQAWIVRESESLGSPSSHECLKAFVSGWTWRAKTDPLRQRNTRQSGIRSDAPQEMRQSDLQDRSHKNKPEGSNDEEACSKHVVTKVIKDTHAAGKDTVDMIL